MLLRKLKRLLILVVVSLLFSHFVLAKPFQLQLGDLLFQDLDCGFMCNGIDKVTYGFADTDVSHVGMVTSVKDSHVMVIEAGSKGVVETLLSVFLARSHDQFGHPRVMVGRLVADDQYLIPAAITGAKANLGKPYNVSFTPNQGQSYYCSQLIHDAFAQANGGQAIFHQHPMNFDDPETGKLAPAWRRYFSALHTSPPQGQLGTNPGQLSREANIKIIYHYGQLRHVAEHNIAK